MGSSNKKEFWEGKWRSTTLPAFHNLEVSESVKSLEKLFSCSSEVLIPLCGKTVDLIYLSARVSKVTGVEFVKSAIDQFFTENKLEPTIISNCYQNSNIRIFCHDIFRLELNKKFDVILDRAALIALSKIDRKNIAKL